MNKICVNTQAIVVEADGLEMFPMADMWDRVTNSDGPAYFVCGFNDPYGFHRVGFSVLARDLARVIFP